jgi:hypothetical protein
MSINDNIPFTYDAATNSMYVDVHKGRIQICFDNLNCIAIVEGQEFEEDSNITHIFKISIGSPLAMKHYPLAEIIRLARMEYEDTDFNNMTDEDR